MYPVSQAFLNAASALERQVVAKVVVDYTDPFLDQSIAVAANEEANISYPDQTADAVTEPTHKWASLDGSWMLDGTCRLAPDTPEDAEQYQMGWWGAQLAGAGGAFASPYPSLTVIHMPRPVHTLRVAGDSARDEYPVDFEIGLYAQDDTLLKTESVTGNVDVAWSVTLPVPILDVAKQVLTITRWSHEGRQTKILEFFTSIQETYEGDDIFLISLLEEREVSHGSLPIGNISANEIDIRLDNSSRRFDAGNTQSPLYQLLKPNRRIRAWLGVKHDDESMEWVPLGVFWSGDWVTSEDGLYAQTTGRDKLDMLAKSTYSTSQVAVGATLYDLATAVLQDTGLEATEYGVDEALKAYVVPYAWFEPQSHREALRKIAEASLSAVYCDRHGIVRIEGVSKLEASTATRYAFLQGAVFPARVEVPDAFGISVDDYYRKDNPAKWSEVANLIEVETQPLRPDVAQEVYRSNEPVSISAGQTLTLTAYYNEPPCIDVVASLEDAPAGCSIAGVTYYAWGATVKVSSPNAGTFTLVIEAKPLKVLNKERATARDEASITEHGTLRYRFPGNPLVQTREVAQTIADTLLTSFRESRRDLDMEWRGNPALLLGDPVLVPDSRVSGRDVRGLYRVIQQEIEWTGALRARLKGRRI